MDGENRFLTGSRHRKWRESEEVKDGILALRSIVAPSEVSPDEWVYEAADFTALCVVLMRENGIRYFPPRRSAVPRAQGTDELKRDPLLPIVAAQLNVPEDVLRRRLREHAQATGTSERSLLSRIYSEMMKDEAA